MIIDYASRPPSPEFDQSKATHLANYRRVYAASESKVADARFRVDDGVQAFLARRSNR